MCENARERSYGCIIRNTRNATLHLYISKINFSHIRTAYTASCNDLIRLVCSTTEEITEKEEATTEATTIARIARLFLSRFHDPPIMDIFLRVFCTRTIAPPETPLSRLSPRTLICSTIPSPYCLALHALPWRGPPRAVCWQRDSIFTELPCVDHFTSRSPSRSTPTPFSFP